MLEVFPWWPQLGKGFLSTGFSAARGRWTQGKANGLCLLLELKSSHLTTFAWGASQAWDGLLAFIWVYQYQAEEVRSQAGITEVVFHILKKIKLKHTLKPIDLFEKKKKKLYEIKLSFRDVAWNLISPGVLFRLTASL